MASRCLSLEVFNRIFDMADGTDGLVCDDIEILAIFRVPEASDSEAAVSLQSASVFEPSQPYSAWPFDG